MKKFMTSLTILFTVLAFSTAAFAASSFSGKVIKIDGTKVTVAAEQDLPKWVKKGNNVSALGGSPKVLEVNGKEMVLRFGKQKAETIKIDSSVSISEPADDELQGC